MRTSTTRAQTRSGTFLAVALATALTGAAPASPGAPGCSDRVNNTHRNLQQCVTLDGVRAHQAAFQAIADANGDTRASGTPGYDASADYVAGMLEDAGYDVTRQVFDFPYFEELAPAVLEQVAPDATSYETGTFEFSGEGDVTGPVTPVDLNLAQPGGASTSGCESSDFDSVDLSGPDDVVLLQRGTCFFSDKALNAQTAGAEAVIIFNQGNTPGRTGLIVGTLGGESAGVITVPVVGASFADGVDLASPSPGTVARVATTVFSEIRPTENVLAESRHGRTDNVVVAGAHLDSVLDGPGVQDNGSGSAALLEVAIQMAKVKPVNQVRFAWWGAEESGLLGSEHYVGELSDGDLADIALYLNFDMIGSPNHVFMVYDADESTFTAPVTIPPGSTAIEDEFERFYSSHGLPYDDSQFSGRSDYQAFILAGIPAGGLFTGAEVVKTEAQAAIWGGTVGDQFDPCYHLSCDTFDNVSATALDVNSDAVAHAVLHFAHSTQPVNGVKGTPVPGAPGRTPSIDGPRGTFGSGGGGVHGGDAHDRR